MNKKFVYRVGNNKKVILWCTANQISRIHTCCAYSFRQCQSTCPLCYSWYRCSSVQGQGVHAKVIAVSWTLYIKWHNSQDKPALCWQRNLNCILQPPEGSNSQTAKQCTSTFILLPLNDNGPQWPKHVAE